MNPRAFFANLEARIERLEKIIAELKAKNPEPAPEKRGPGRPPKAPQ